MERVNNIPLERIERYLGLTKAALEKAKIVAPKRSFAYKQALSFQEMAQSYYQDAVHNYQNGDDVLAYAQVNYAHGWIDAGARMGFFDVGEDDQLFTLLE